MPSTCSRRQERRDAPVDGELARDDARGGDDGAQVELGCEVRAAVDVGVLHAARLADHVDVVVFRVRAVRALRLEPGRAAVRRLARPARDRRRLVGLAARRRGGRVLGRLVRGRAALHVVGAEGAGRRKRRCRGRGRDEALRRRGLEGEEVQVVGFHLGGLGHAAPGRPESVRLDEVPVGGRTSVGTVRSFRTSRASGDAPGSQLGARKTCSGALVHAGGEVDGATTCGGLDREVVRRDGVDGGARRPGSLGIEPELEREEVVGLADGEVVEELVRADEVVALVGRDRVELVVQRDGGEDLEEDGVDETLCLQDVETESVKRHGAVRGREEREEGDARRSGSPCRGRATPWPGPSRRRRQRS